MQLDSYFSEHWSPPDRFGEWIIIALSIGVGNRLKQEGFIKDQDIWIKLCLSNSQLC